MVSPSVRSAPGGATSRVMLSTVDAGKVPSVFVSMMLLSTIVQVY